MADPKFSNILLVSSFSLLFFFNHSLSSSSSDDLCNPQDKKVLVRIKSYLSNPLAMASWDLNTDCCGWEDIGCNEQGRVNMLGIRNAVDIHASLPPFLDQLPFIWSLTISNIPNLSGPIPSSIGKLTKLKQLTISETNVTGPIPEFLSKLTKLDILYLSSSGHIGPIPDFLGRLTNLRQLDLSSNKLTGPIPPALGQLNKLDYLHLSSNKLSGPIPDFIGLRMKNLITIDLISNSLTGPIPSSLGLLPNLSTLSLSSNHLTGPIPKSLGQANLLSLNLGNNQFTGDASFLFEKSYTGIVVLELNNNLLKFDFSNVDLGRNIMGFNVSHNVIYGSLPRRFGQLGVDSVDVSHNQLCGPIPNGRRFKRANPDIFAHNKCLCGGPLGACKNEIA